MGTWLRKIRGIAGLGLVGGAIGAVVGGVWSAVSSLLAFGVVVPALVANAAVVWGVFGAFSGAGFATLLATVASRRSLEDLGVAWSGLLGGVAGAIFPLAINVLMSASLGPVYLIGQMLPVMILCGSLGALLSSGMVVAAKRAEKAELAAPESSRKLTD